MCIALLAMGASIVSACSSGGSSASSNTSSSCSATKVAEQGLPSVVAIHVQAGSSGGNGSGEVIRSDGYVLTNNHVISAAAQGGSITVLFSDGKTDGASIVGRDPQTDLAVLKVNEKRSLPVIPFGDSSKLAIGQPVLALGAPLGLANTATAGIVSSLERSVQVPSDNGRTALLVAAVQTDAAINPGNSGGALVDCDGKLIGVPTAGATVPNPQGGRSTGNIGIGFAIPSDIAKSISNEIISTGRVTHAFFGLNVTPIPASAAQQLGTSQGLYVQVVTPGGPAASAGIQTGDIITALNGTSAAAAEQLQALTLTKRPGDTVPVTYHRDGAQRQTTITLGTQPSQ
jgi:putative serine protease PepD